MGFTEQDIQDYLEGSRRIDQAQAELSQVWGAVRNPLYYGLPPDKFRHHQIFATVSMTVKGREFNLNFRRGGTGDILVKLEGGEFEWDLTDGFPHHLVLPLREALPRILSALDEAVPEAKIRKNLDFFIRAGSSEE